MPCPLLGYRWVTSLSVSCTNSTGYTPGPWLGAQGKRSEVGPGPLLAVVIISTSQFSGLLDFVCSLLSWCRWVFPQKTLSGLLKPLLAPIQNRNFMGTYISQEVWSQWLKRGTWLSLASHLLREWERREGSFKSSLSHKSPKSAVLILALQVNLASRQIREYRISEYGMKIG